MRFFHVTSTGVRQGKEDAKLQEAESGSSEQEEFSRENDRKF